MFRTASPTTALPSEEKYNEDYDAGSPASFLNCRQQAKLARHHPNVKLPPRLQDKSKKEQIERCCNRFKSFPAAVDTLYKTLYIISSDPSEQKYRVIDKTNPGYQRSLANVPGTEQLLRSVNFISSEGASTSNLVLHSLDPELLQTALNCLERTKSTQEYKQAKHELDFVKDMDRILKEIPTETELVQRKLLLSKCPKEATKGRGALIDVVIPTTSDSASERKTTFRRRFDGDDTLDDVLNWLGGQVGTIFLQNIRNRQWSLVDINRYPRDIPIDCDGEPSTSRTLQNLGFWPSGRLIVRPPPPQE